MLLHFVIPVNWIYNMYNMTMFLKKVKFDILTPSQGSGWGRRGCSAFGTCSHRPGLYISNICMIRAMTDAAMLAVQI